MFANNSAWFLVAVTVSRKGDITGIYWVELPRGSGEGSLRVVRSMKTKKHPCTISLDNRRLNEKNLRNIDIL